MKIILFIIICISFSNSKILDISDIQSYKSTDYIYYIEDNNYTFENILNNNSMSFLEKKNLKISNKIFWTKLTIKNNTNDFKQIVMNNNLAGMNLLDVYLIKNNKLYKTLFLGDLREQRLRNIIDRYSNFILQLEPNEEVVVISKLENYLVYNLNWEITNIETFYNKELKLIFLFGIFGGVLILFCIFNLFNFYIYKKSEYLIICGLTFSILSYQFSFNGILYFLNFNFNLKLITALAWDATTLVGFFLSLFSIIFFQLRKKYKKFFICSVFFLVTCLILISFLIFAQFVNNYFFNYYWLIILNNILLIIYLNILALYMFRKKEKGSIYYLIGNIILLIVIIINTLAIVGIIDYQEELKFLAPLAYIIDILSMLVSIYIKNNIEQKELKKAKNLLLEQSKFSSIGQAIGHISHQWKSPLGKLGTLITLLETISEHKIEELNKTFKSKLPLMKNSIELMKNSIDEFSDFYTVKNETEIFSPIPCIQNILEILNSKIILKRVNVNLDISPDLKIRSFEHILSNIFLVLIDNSLDAFCDENKDNQIFISCENDRNNVIITYIDNAGGIKIKPIESVFDYSVSLKDDKDSSGMGLAIAKMLITDKLNGKINVINYKDGTKFTIII